MTPLKRLVRAEVQRIAASRIVRVGAYGLPIVVGVFGIARLLGHDTDVDAAWRSAEAAFHRYRETMAAHGRQTPPEADVQSFYDDPRYLMAKASFVDMRAWMSGLAAVGLGLGILAGGADWGSRVMLSLAAAEPRRTRLFATRGAIVAALAGAMALACASVLLPLLLLAAAVNGSTADTGGRYWVVMTVIVLRGVLFVALTTLLGYGLAMATRNMAVALGVAVGYLVLGERLIREYLADAVEYHLSGLAFAVLNERPMLPRDAAPADCTGAAACRAFEQAVSATTGFAGLACYVLPVLLAAWYRFRRSDVA